MRKTLTIGCATLVAASLLGADLLAQRGGRRFRREGPPPQPQPNAPAPAKPAAKVERWVAVEGADVYLGTGQLLRRATVLIGDDKIHAVGHDLDIPEKAERIDARGKVVCPGFVAVKARGLGAPSSVSGDTKDSLNPFDPAMKRALAAGVTAVLASFQSGSSAPGGRTAVVKLAWGDLDGMVVQENPVYSMRVPLNPTDLAKLRELVEKAKEHEKKDAEYRANGSKGDAPKAPGDAETVLKILRGEARLWIGGGGGGGGGGFGRGRGGGGGGFDNTDIRQALAIAELLGVGVVLDDPLTAWSIPDEIAATGSMAILNPRARVDPDPGRPDETGSNIAAAAILSEVGVPVAVTCPSGRFGGAGAGTGGILGQDLNTPHMDAAYAVRGGMDNRKALRTLTLDAARIAGVESRLGSIEAGKDADLLILDGDPLHYATFVETAIVNGKVVYEKDKEPFYRHIKR